MKLSTGDVGVLLCADGMVVMAESEEGLQSSLQALSEAMGRWDLKVNWKKTKVIKVHPLHILNTSHTHSMDTYHTHAPPTPTPPPPTHTHTHTHTHTQTHTHAAPNSLGVVCDDVTANGSRTASNRAANED